MRKRTLIYVYIADWAIVSVLMWLLGFLVVIVAELEFGPSFRPEGSSAVSPGIAFDAPSLLVGLFVYFYVLNRFWHRTYGIWDRKARVVPSPEGSRGNHVLHAALLTIESFPAPVIGIAAVLFRKDGRRFSDAMAGFAIVPKE